MSTAARIDEFLRQLVARGAVPGVSVAIEAPGLAHRCAFGVAAMQGDVPLTVDTGFALGCITKLFTGLAALRLSARGALDLDAPLQHYLPELTRPGTDDIRVRHLASHTSGFEGLALADPRVSHMYSWEKFVEFFRTAPRTFTPGAVFNYDHTEHVMLGEILKRISGKEAGVLLEEFVFEPSDLGGCATRAGSGARAADHASDPQSGKYRQIPAPPFCRFWELSLSHIALSPSQIIRVVNRLVRADDRMNAAVVHLPAMTGPARHELMPRAFGLGCAHYGSALSGHNGSARGQTCGVRFDAAAGVSIVVALNAWQPYVRDHILGKIAQIARADAPPPAAARAGAPVAFAAGRYSGGVVGTEIGVVPAGDGVDVDITSRYSKTPMKIRVSRDADGAVSVGEEAGHLSLGAFRDPSDGAACIMVGMNAFKRLQ